LLKHGWRTIADEFKGDSQPIDLIVVLLSNAPAVTTEMLDAG